MSGWFGGKKEASTSPTPEAHAPNKPIRAKLGEQSSFVYDEKLKRWVNKKAGAEDTAAKSSATPPPPKAGPPRSSSTGPPIGGNLPRPTSSSSMHGPPMGGAGSRVVSDSSPVIPSPLAQADGSPSAYSPLLAPQAPLMTRTISNGSVASRTGSVPPSRPGTGMSNASSIDDLLGPPGLKGPKKAGAAGAAGGTQRGRKKGRGYVDLMAGGAPGAAAVGGDK